MREKFEKIPPPLQKQIIMRCGAALVSLLLMVVFLLLEGNLYLSLSVLLFFAFYGFSALQLLYRAVTDQIVVIRGHCTGLEKTPMRRRIKTLYLWSDPHTVKIQIAGKLRNVDEGDIITVYTATGTPVYCDFPSEHWVKIRTNNVIERMNREIRRRTRVVGAFPDGNSALMLVCARLRHAAGTQWGCKKYMNMKHLETMEQEPQVG